MARLLTRPIRRLERAAARIGRGDLDAPVRRDVARRDRPRRRDAGGRCAQQLRARDERMQMMLAGIAHEVRNPLGGMELYAGLLRDELAGDAEKLAHVQRIERELGHLKIIVSDFLEYARRPKPAARRPRRRRAARRGARPGRRRRAAAQGRACTLDAPSRRAPPCDAGQLRRALAQPGAERGAGLRRRRHRRGHARLRARGRRGASSPCATPAPASIPTSLAKIWTPFYTTKQSGTGLGLAFVRDIARDHGARLDVDSAPGRGTTFTLALAARRA